MANDKPPTKSDENMTKRHTVSSLKYNIAPHSVDHLDGAVKALDRLKQYDATKAKSLGKWAVKKISPAVKKLQIHADGTNNLLSAKKAVTVK